MIEVEASAPSRRELNKTATREAIAAAALDLLRSKGMGGFTADDVAMQADVSRRTFFNYFPSPEAALASHIQNYLEAVMAELLARPEDEPLLESARHALSAVTDPAQLAPIAEIFTLTQNSAPLARFELEAWDHCSEQMAAVAASKLSSAAKTPLSNELYIQTLVGSVMSGGKAALRVWFTQTGAAITEESLATLRELLSDAMAILQHGFTH